MSIFLASNESIIGNTRSVFQNLIPNIFENSNNKINRLKLKAINFDLSFPTIKSNTYPHILTILTPNDLQTKKFIRTFPKVLRKIEEFKLLYDLCRSKHPENNDLLLKIRNYTTTFELYKNIFESRGVVSHIYINYTLKILIYFTFFEDIIFNNNTDEVIKFLNKKGFLLEKSSPLKITENGYCTVNFKYPYFLSENIVKLLGIKRTKLYTDNSDLPELPLIDIICPTKYGYGDIHDTNDTNFDLVSFYSNFFNQNPNPHILDSEKKLIKSYTHFIDYLVYKVVNDYTNFNQIPYYLKLLGIIKYVSTNGAIPAYRDKDGLKYFMNKTNDRKSEFRMNLYANFPKTVYISCNFVKPSIVGDQLKTILATYHISPDENFYQNYYRNLYYRFYHPISLECIEQHLFKTELLDENFLPIIATGGHPTILQLEVDSTSQKMFTIYLNSNDPYNLQKYPKNTSHKFNNQLPFHILNNNSINDWHVSLVSFSSPKFNNIIQEFAYIEIRQKLLMSADELIIPKIKIHIPTDYYDDFSKLCDAINYHISITNLFTIDELGQLSNKELIKNCNDNTLSDENLRQCYHNKNVLNTITINTNLDLPDEQDLGINNGSMIMPRISYTYKKPKFIYNIFHKKFIINSNDYDVFIPPSMCLLLGITFDNTGTSYHIEPNSSEHSVSIPNLNVFEPTSFLVVSNICKKSFFTQKRPQILKFAEYKNPGQSNYFISQFKYLDYVDLEFADIHEIEITLLNINGELLSIQDGNVSVQLRFEKKQKL